MNDAERWVERHRGGAAPADVLALADRLPGVAVEEMTGRWRGAELPTGSPLDGLLTAHRWWGKEVLDAETVHPLLFADRAGRPRPVDPAPAPLALLRRAPGLARSVPVRMAFAAVRPVLTTRRPTARLRPVVHRGVPTAALVYDRLPVVDAFRRVGPDLLLGLMDMRGLPDPFAFLLQRDGADDAGTSPRAHRCPQRAVRDPADPRVVPVRRPPVGGRAGGRRPAGS